MGLITRIMGRQPVEINRLKNELISLRSECKNLENELTTLKQKNVDILYKNQTFVDHLRALIGTLDYEFLAERAWSLFVQAMQITKGALYIKTDTGYEAKVHTGFIGQPPKIPFNENSIVGFALKEKTSFSRELVRCHQELVHYDKVGVVVDVDLVSPILVYNEFKYIVIICSHNNSIFENEKTLDILQMLSTLTGLVFTNIVLQKELETKSAVLAKKQAESKTQDVDGKNAVFKIETDITEHFTGQVAPDVFKLIEQNADKINIHGLKQLIAILLIKINNLPTIISNYAPAKIIESLNEYYNLAAELVLRSKGTIERYENGNFIAFYGGLVKFPNPALTALQTAIMIHKQLEMQTKSFFDKNLPELKVAITIHYQKAILGVTGPSSCTKYSIVGDIIDEIFDLSNMSDDEEVILSANAHSKIGRIQYPVLLKECNPSESKTVKAFSVLYKPQKPVKCPSCLTEVPPPSNYCQMCGRQVRGI